MARPDDDLPEIEVVGGARETRTEVDVESVPSRSRRSRTPWIVGALVVALVTIAVVSSGRDEGSADDEATPSSTSTSRSTTSRAATTSRPTTTERDTGEYLSGSSAPVLRAPVNASVLLGDDEGRWRQLNLDTGWVTDIRELRGFDSYSAVPVTNGLVATTRSDLSFFSIPAAGPGALDKRLADFRVDTEDDEDHTTHQVLATGRPDRLWVLHEIWDSTGSYRSAATLVDLSGRPLTSVQPMAPWTSVANSLGVMFHAGGQAYLAHDAGVTGLGPGRVYAANGSYAALLTCDKGMSCRQTIMDLDTGETIIGGEVPGELAVDDRITMTQSEDGSIATVASPYGALGAEPWTRTLYMTRPDGRTLRSTIEGDRWSAPAWLPGDMGLLVIDGRGLVHISERDGRLAVHQIQMDLQSQMWQVLVVPHGPPRSDP